jgi:predicted negative regulator of RcsB-dependent stress response
VESYRTEDEQVEELRKWWQENGKSTLAAIALALAAGFGWQGWQDHRQTQAEAASVIYEELLQAVSSDPSQEPDAARLASGRHLAEQLKAEYGNSAYAGFAALHLARLAVEEGQLEDAERELQWVLDSVPAEEVANIANLRLARVVAARGDTERAMAILDAADEANSATVAETRGDIYLQQGKRELAREEYGRAAAAAAMGGTRGGGALDIKLQALTPVSAREFENPDTSDTSDTSDTNSTALQAPVSAGEE